MIPQKSQKQNKILIISRTHSAGVLFYPFPEMDPNIHRDQFPCSMINKHTRLSLKLPLFVFSVTFFHQQLEIQCGKIMFF